MSAARGINGLLDPVEPGLACGSDTAHLSILGFDPRRYESKLLTKRQFVAQEWSYTKFPRDESVCVLAEASCIPVDQCNASAFQHCNAVSMSVQNVWHHAMLCKHGNRKAAMAFERCRGCLTPTNPPTLYVCMQSFGFD